MSTITVKIAMSYRGQTYTQCERFNLNKIFVRSLYDRTLQAHVNAVLDEVSRRYDVFDFDKIKISTEIIDLDDIPKEYVVDGKLTDEFWQINLNSLVRRSLPNLMAYDVCDVQPMTGPVGPIFPMRSNYNTMNLASTGTGAFYNED